MSDLAWTAVGSALSLGLLTAISPCPMATNIAAISFLGRRVGQPRLVLLSGLLYTLGRTTAYVGLAGLITAGLLISGDIARLLQTYMNKALGPILILLGMVLLGWIGSGLSWSLGGKDLQKQVESGGIGWAFPLGILFALSFCPISAGLFFGGLIPICVQAGSPWILPTAFGISTALPVIGFAVLIAFAAAKVGKAFQKLTETERWIRYACGVLFILAGIYYCLIHIWEVGS